MNEEQALEIVYGDYDESLYTLIVDSKDDGHVTHDITAYHSIVQRLSDHTYWKIRYMLSYDEGLDEDDIFHYEVEPVEVMTTEWKRKGV